jgi:RNA polymerase sigma-70 factor (ECF subfamily)
VPEPGHRNSGSSHGTGPWIERPVLEGTRRRDPDALARFFDVVFPYVYSLAFRLMGDRHAAEDVAQDVFLKIYRAADRLDIDLEPKPWITTITYNACRDIARRRASRPEDSVDVSTIEDSHAAGGTPENDVLRREREMAVEGALLELDEPLRTVVVLFSYCGFSHEEIAGIVGASHAAVRKRYSRALKRMAQSLEGQLG